MLLAWLRAERETNANIRAFAAVPEIATLLDTPNIDDPEENRGRLRLFYIARWVFFFEIPPDTCWYEVHHLRDDDLAALHTVNFGEWNDPGDRNELIKVAARKQFDLLSSPEEWGSIILWGHERSGPFTIIEGNHRLTAYARSGRSGLNIPVFVGLSGLKCHWHILDQCPVIVQDLIA